MLLPLLEEDLFEVGFAVWFGDVAFEGDGAVGWVFDGLLDWFFGGCGFAVDGGQVYAGDLEAVEEQAGAAGVELVGGDALQDAGDGELDGGAVFDEVEVEGFAAGEGGFAVAGVLDGDSGGVVEVAELLVAEAGGAATEAVGFDVAALERLELASSVCMCVGTPYPVFVCKIFNRLELGSYQPCGRIRDVWGGEPRLATLSLPFCSLL